MRGRAPSPFPEAARTTAGSPTEPAQDLSSPAGEAEAEELEDEDGDEDEDEDKQDAIPPLASMAPAIFAPAVGDYTEPPAPEPDPGQQLQSVLGELDAHAAAVRANIQAMVLREAARLQGECARSEAALRANMGPAWSPSLPPPPPPDAERAFLLNMEADALDPGTTAVLPLTFSHHEVPERLPDPRDAPCSRALTQLLNLVRRGMTEVDGYAAHAQGVKNATVQAYAAEMAKQHQNQAATSGHATTTPMDLS